MTIESEDAIRAQRLNDSLGAISDTWLTIPEFIGGDVDIQHIAFICDGNRRAGVDKGLLPQDGHRLGLETIRGITRACRQWSIPTATFWLWSTENWKRSEDQVSFLMSLAVDNLQNTEIISELISNKVKFKHLGRKDRLPVEVKEGLLRLENLTESFSSYNLNVALDYGGVEELNSAALGLAQDVLDGKLSLGEAKSNPDIILNYLYTSDQSDPEIVIRTGMDSGELPRTSGFFPLQAAYASWIFMPTKFPDLTPDELLSSLHAFQKYTRRLGS